jgi:hypothetical protein
MGTDATLNQGEEEARADRFIAKMTYLVAKWAGQSEVWY